MKRLFLAFLAALMLVGCGAAGVGNDSKTKPNDENTTEPAEVQTQAQMVETETAPTNETQSTTDSLPDSEQEPTDNSLPIVYMTSDISSDGLMAVYEALGADPEGKIAVKLSTGEPGSNYLRTDLIGELVQSLGGTIVECNTAYGGQRANTALHYQLAKDHGYTDIADVDIMDEDGSMALTVESGSNLTENYVGSHFANYDYFVVLSHFKGHAMACFGGAIKNAAGLSHMSGRF